MLLGVAVVYADVMRPGWRVLCTPGIELSGAWRLQSIVCTSYEGLCFCYLRALLTLMRIDSRI